MAKYHALGVVLLFAMAGVSVWAFFVKTFFNAHMA